MNTARTTSWGLLVALLAASVEPGELHVADQELVVVSMSYGVSRHFSVWGALSIQ
jgi:hypothetical protein